MSGTPIDCEGHVWSGNGYISRDARCHRCGLTPAEVEAQSQEVLDAEVALLRTRVERQQRVISRLSAQLTIHQDERDQALADAARQRRTADVLRRRLHWVAWYLGRDAARLAGDAT